MNEIPLTIAGQDIVADTGTTVLKAALENGIYIPRLCYHPDSSPCGACRLCIVEIDKGQLVPSCLLPVEQGMVVRTKSSEIDKLRRSIVELLIADHHTDCRNCPSSGQCELQRIMARLHINVKRMRPLRWAKEEPAKDTSHPLFDYDPSRCVLCGICVKTCEDIQGIIRFIGRGYTTKVGFFGDKTRCESCGKCVERCPVGALVPKNVLMPST